MSGRSGPSTASAEHPTVVYRWVQEEWQADALVNGHVYVGTLDKYRAIEDAERGDAGEGSLAYFLEYAHGDGSDPTFQRLAAQAGIRVENSRNTTIRSSRSFTSLPNAWVVCTTLRYEPEAAANLGSYCVAIRWPTAFLALLTDAVLTRMELRESLCAKVRYVERSYKDDDVAPGHPGFIKPPDRYAHQEEYRFLLSPVGRRVITPRSFFVPGASDLIHRIR